MRLPMNLLISLFSFIVSIKSRLQVVETNHAHTTGVIFRRHGAGKSSWTMRLLTPSNRYSARQYSNAHLNSSCGHSQVYYHAKCTQLRPQHKPVNHHNNHRKQGMAHRGIPAATIACSGIKRPVNRISSNIIFNRKKPKTANWKYNDTISTIGQPFTGKQLFYSPAFGYRLYNLIRYTN